MRASPLSSILQRIETRDIGGSTYVVGALDGDRDPASEVAPVVARLATISELYEYFPSIADVEGPFLRPVPIELEPFVPLEMAEVRRYKGKTSDVFSNALLNLGIFASAYAQPVGEPLRVFDPLVGGGTTLFLALAYGHDAFGVDVNASEVERTATFMRRYFQEERIAHKVIKERVPGGTRFRYEVGRKPSTRHVAIASGDSTNASRLLAGIPGGLRMHVVAADLPYGIQHYGQARDLLRQALPEWTSLLVPGGAVALAWDATRLERGEALALAGDQGDVRWLDDEPYTSFAHQVDRVIKKRDVLVGVRTD